MAWFECPLLPFACPPFRLIVRFVSSKIMRMKFLGNPSLWCCPHLRRIARGTPRLSIATLSKTVRHPGRRIITNEQRSEGGRKLPSCCGNFIGNDFQNQHWLMRQANIPMKQTSIDYADNAFRLECFTFVSFNFTYRVPQMKYNYMPLILYSPNLNGTAKRF